MFDPIKKKTPLGIDLVKRGLLSEEDLDKAINYQRQHPEIKLGEAIDLLHLCDPTKLIELLAEKLGEKPVILTNNIKMNVNEILPVDLMKENKVIPFELIGNKVKVAFGDPENTRIVETIRLILMNKGLLLDKYITFQTHIDRILENIHMTETKHLDNSSDIINLIDNIIRQAIEKRASDIHIEPCENNVRIRFRIDGELLSVGEVEKSKQFQMIGRLKAISNMHQEKQDSQDGRIEQYADYNIRVSSQRNVFGEKFVLRLLRKNSNIKELPSLGFPVEDEVAQKCFSKKNSMLVVSAPTGEGKTTTLYSMIHRLNKPEINITSIENPVEVVIQGTNQIEIDANTKFVDSLRTVLRQDPDIILVGEIRDKETAEIAIEAGHTGHFVLSTIHTINAVETITRFRKLGISNYDIASTIGTSISQRLVRKICSCATKRPFNQFEIDFISSIATKYGDSINFDELHTYEPCGCEQCNNTGFYDRIGIFEILDINEQIREMIDANSSTTSIRQYAVANTTYRPLEYDGILKVLAGYTTVEEIKRKLGIV